MIPFNKPFLTGKEAHYIYQAVYSGKISGNGIYTKKCDKFFEQRYGIKKALLTTSCTDALEMCAMLAEIGVDDEVIVPSYTFVSSALAFVRQGARIVFADSREDHPGIDEASLRPLITAKTKAIVVVHYAGIACDMDAVMKLAQEFNLIVIEDAAHAIESFYKGRSLGSIGHLATFSFHETKNINSGEGGMLAINDERFIRRAEIIWEKGTNRAEFFRGEVNKYNWIDTGSSFLPSEIIAAYLWAQVENLELIQQKRCDIWQQYMTSLQSWAATNDVSLPVVHDYATQNGHLFYIVCRSLDHRNLIINRLKQRSIFAVSHYLSLHKSPFYAGKHDGRTLPQSDRYTDRLLRLPLYYELEREEIDSIVKFIVADHD